MKKFKEVVMMSLLVGMLAINVQAATTNRGMYTYDTMAATCRVTIQPNSSQHMYEGTLADYLVYKNGKYTIKFTDDSGVVYTASINNSNAYDVVSKLQAGKRIKVRGEIKSSTKNKAVLSNCLIEEFGTTPSNTDKTWFVTPNPLKVNNTENSSIPVLDSTTSSDVSELNNSYRNKLVKVNGRVLGLINGRAYIEVSNLNNRRLIIVLGKEESRKFTSVGAKVNMTCKFTGATTIEDFLGNTVTQIKIK